MWQIPAVGNPVTGDTFANEDFMPHNLLLVQPGKIDEIANQALTMGAAGFANGFIPDNKNIIWHTKLLDAGKEEVLEFNAPAKPGDSPYMCSFPGITSSCAG